VQTVQAAFELLDKRYARADARDLSVELGDRLVQARRLPGAVLDELQLARDRIHLRFELGRQRCKRRHALAERFEAEPIGAELLDQPRRVAMSLREFLDFLAEHVEILATLPDRIELPRRLPGDVVGVSQA